MTKTSTKILITIGTLLLMGSIFLGATYILTSDTLIIDNTFVGHALNEDQNLQQITIIGGMLSLVSGLLFITIGTIIETKGMTRSEKWEWTKKNLLILTIGSWSQLFLFFILWLLVPKNSWGPEDFWDATIYYLILAGFIALAIVLIRGLFRAFVASKKKIYTPKTTDEF